MVEVRREEHSTGARLFVGEHDRSSDQAKAAHTSGDRLGAPSDRVGLGPNRGAVANATGLPSSGLTGDDPGGTGDAHRRFNGNEVVPRRASSQGPPSGNGRDLGHRHLQATARGDLGRRHTRSARASSRPLGSISTTSPDPYRDFSQIARDRAAGKGYSQIARELQKAGVPTAQGGRQWHASTVRAAFLRATHAPDD